MTSQYVVDGERWPHRPLLGGGRGMIWPPPLSRQPSPGDSPYLKCSFILCPPHAYAWIYHPPMVQGAPLHLRRSPVPCQAGWSSKPSLYNRDSTRHVPFPFSIPPRSCGPRILLPAFWDRRLWEMTSDLSLLPSCCLLCPHKAHTVFAGMPSACSSFCSDWSCALPMLR